MFPSEIKVENYNGDKRIRMSLKQLSWRMIEQMAQDKEVLTLEFVGVKYELTLVEVDIDNNKVILKLET